MIFSTVFATPNSETQHRPRPIFVLRRHLSQSSPRRESRGLNQSSPALNDHTRTLVNRARQADRQAIDELFRRYREPLRRALGRMLGQRYRLHVADSEDAAQDAILQALGRIDRFEHRGEGSFLAWLVKSAEFEILNKMRALDTDKRRAGQGPRLGETAVPEPVAPDPGVSHAARTDELRDQIRLCLDRMPQAERDVIVLSRFMNLTTDEVREELDMPTQGAVRALLSRAQARLTGLLAQAGITGGGES